MLGRAQPRSTGTDYRDVSHGLFRLQQEQASERHIVHLDFGFEVGWLAVERVEKHAKLFLFMITSRTMLSGKSCASNFYPFPDHH